MKIEEMLEPSEVADFLGETAHNIRITYKNKKLLKYKALIIGVIFLREKVTPRELEEALFIIKAKREYARSKRAKKNISG